MDEIGQLSAGDLVVSRPIQQCRGCGSWSNQPFVDLGVSPLANAYLSREQLNSLEKFYPLRAFVCKDCFLVQLEQFSSREELFSQYAYFSSYAQSWLKHASDYVHMMIERFGFNQTHQVVEIASNDGYLLQYFRESGIPVLGVEPALNVAREAQKKNIPTVIEFFGVGVAQELVDRGTGADLLIGNNVLAHVPDLNDFVEGLKIVLKPDGILTMEFPHLLQLMDQNQFDTIYHEHFFYYSLLAVEHIFASHELTIFDVEELPSHGGSLRIYVRHEGIRQPEITERVKHLRKKELLAQLDKLETYKAFWDKVKATKRQLLKLLIEIKTEGKSVVGYGAPAKGNTLLNFCGIGSDFVDYTVDRSPHKQGLFLPGTRIPILHTDEIAQTRPDYLFILPWNLKEEIMEQMSLVREWGGRFLVPIPEARVYT